MTRQRHLDRVHALLQEGQATSVELAAELDLPVKQVCVALRRLWKAGAATRRLMNTKGETGRPPWLYAATGAAAPVRQAGRVRLGEISFPPPSGDLGTIKAALFGVDEGQPGSDRCYLATFENGRLVEVEELPTR